ncbi:MAG: DsbA family protein [Anaerolineales bacterium]|nr:DsbA family protein [Anaerolineales bacterium]
MASNRQERLERRRFKEKQGQFRWLIYMGIGALVLVGLIALSQRFSGPRQVTYTQKNGVELGSPDAPVTMIEFLDFQCPHCLNSYNSVEHDVITQYVDTGKVRLIYQAVGYLGPDSVNSAEAAYCAADQNLFWEFHDVIFAPVNFSNGNTGGYSDDNLVRMAGQVSGMDVDAFRACLSSDEQLQAVQAAHGLATTFGISGTPAFVINGQVLAGAQPFARLQQAFEEALSAAGAN